VKLPHLVHASNLSMHKRTAIQTICYISNSSKLKDEEIEDLLVESKTNNNRIGIGGVLIYTNETFFQILEGNKTDVDSLFEKIAIDKRHFNVFKIFEIETSIKKFDRFNSNYIKSNDQSVTTNLLSFLENNDGNNIMNHEKLVEKAECLLYDYQ